MDSTKVLKEINVSVEEILNDYKLALISRHTSLLGRKEVFTGKAKFGIFGDGKELCQIAMAKAFKRGDFRSGYYRDQTFMMALGELNVQQFFAQLYAHTDLEAEPMSGGRMMNGHFATRLLDEKGEWLPQTEMYNSAADVSPTAGQMPRLVGLAYASKLYRGNPHLRGMKNFSLNGNEIAFGTIGNGATSEGIFFESINAAGVLQIPMLVAVWDDGYGISVPNELHTTKADITKVLQGFQRNEKEKGIELIKVNGWDYGALIEAFLKAEKICRKDHVPVVLHVDELTQPLGHSTSGSHERYKSAERLEWEKEYDCIKKFKEWILENEFAHQGQLDGIEAEAIEHVKQSKTKAWKEYAKTVDKDCKEALALLDQLNAEAGPNDEVLKLRSDLHTNMTPLKQDAVKALKFALRIFRNQEAKIKQKIQQWLNQKDQVNQKDYSTYLYSASEDSAIKISEVKPVYKENSPVVDGREVLQACFDANLARDPRILAFGEDVGKIGDVNQAFAGLQAKYGDLRVTDTSIRETTIIGQGIGLALRGLKPIAEIQYLDYLIYAMQTLSDDLACLQYRTVGQQKAPVIIRTRGHRLEGVWHSGSPLGMILGSMRGIYVLVPRNMTQAAGFYNTLLRSDDPAILIECLNGYRLKERIPDNIGEFTMPLGVPEILKEGTDITVVTYGAMVKVVMEAAAQLEGYGISLEVIDVQTLVPFDVNKIIVESIKKTNRVIFADEDVPGGGSAYMMQQVLDKQNAYQWLDSKPMTVSSKEHRPAYGSDGDYFSKPNVEDIFDFSYLMMHEADPKRFPKIYDIDLERI